MYCCLNNSTKQASIPPIIYNFVSVIYYMQIHASKLKNIKTFNLNFFMFLCNTINLLLTDQKQNSK